MLLFYSEAPLLPTHKNPPEDLLMVWTLVTNSLFKSKRTHYMHWGPLGGFWMFWNVDKIQLRKHQQHEIKRHIPLFSQTGHECCLPQTVCLLRCSSPPCWRTLSSCPETHRQHGGFCLCFSLTAGQIMKITWTHHSHSLVHVTVAEDDERRLSPELKRHFLHVTDRTALDGEKRRHIKMSCNVTFSCGCILFR